MVPGDESVYPSDGEAFAAALEAVQDGEGYVLVPRPDGGDGLPPAVEKAAVPDGRLVEAPLSARHYVLNAVPSPTARVLGGGDHEFRRLAQRLPAVLAAEAVVVRGEPPSIEPPEDDWLDERQPHEPTPWLGGNVPRELPLDPERAPAVEAVFEADHWAWLPAAARSRFVQAARELAVGAPYRAHAYARGAVRAGVESPDDEGKIRADLGDAVEDGDDPVASLAAANRLFERPHEDLQRLHGWHVDPVAAAARAGDHGRAVALAFNEAVGAVHLARRCTEVAFKVATDDVSDLTSRDIA